MSITATVILDSLSPLNPRLTTIEYTAPRMILPELNTHRVFSRNAASSRAIPIRRIINSVKENPVIPIWTKNQPGMQGKRITDYEEILALNIEWLKGRDAAVAAAEELVKLGAHKQAVNRLLEPYLYFKGVITATEWTNFFALRNHPDAQPEIELLAQAIQKAYDESTPTLLRTGEWHIPYLSLGDEFNLNLEDRLKVSVARCARVSYKTFDDDKISSIDKDRALFQQLFDSKHMSPFEHQAYAVPSIDWAFSRELMGNFVGFGQYRKLLEQGLVGL